MKIKISHVTFFLTICIILFTVATCRRNQKLPPEVRIAVNPTAFFLPLFVAQDQKFFSNRGINTKFLMLNSTGQATNLFLSGGAEVSALGAGGLFAIDEKAFSGVQFLYNQYNHSYSLIVLKNSPVSKLEDLKGAKIGVWPSPTPEVYLRLLLEARIGKRNFTVVPVDSRFLHHSLLSGSVDAIFVADVHARHAILNGDCRYLSRFPLAEYVTDPFFHGGGLIRTDFCNKYPELAKSIRSAIQEAVDFIEKHPDEARKSLIHYLGVTEQIAATTDIDLFRQVDYDGKEAAQKLANDLFSQEILKNRVDVTEFFRGM